MNISLPCRGVNKVSGVQMAHPILGKERMGWQSTDWRCAGYRKASLA